MRVLLMQWDDKTSLNTPYLRSGLMGTHDEARALAPPQGFMGFLPALNTPYLRNGLMGVHDAARTHASPPGFFGVFALAEHAVPAQWPDGHARRGARARLPSWP